MKSLHLQVATFRLNLFALIYLALYISLSFFYITARHMLSPFVTRYIKGVFLSFLILSPVPSQNVGACSFIMLRARFFSAIRRPCSTSTSTRGSAPPVGTSAKHSSTTRLPTRSTTRSRISPCVLQQLFHLLLNGVLYFAPWEAAYLIRIKFNCFNFECIICAGFMQMV